MAGTGPRVPPRHSVGVHVHRTPPSRDEYFFVSELGDPGVWSNNSLPVAVKMVVRCD